MSIRRDVLTCPLPLSTLPSSSCLEPRPTSPHLFEFDPEQHSHLIPPPSDDEAAGTVASDSDAKDSKPKVPRAPMADKAGVRGSGRGLSKEEIDTEDEESD